LSLQVIACSVAHNITEAYTDTISVALVVPLAVKRVQNIYVRIDHRRRRKEVTNTAIKSIAPSKLREFTIDEV
jgi:hypothetical protein